MNRVMEKTYSLWLRNIKQEVDTKDLRKMESEMAKENSSTKTAATMMEIGKTIKCMDGENYSIKVENSLMKEIGLMMNSMAMVKFTMTTLCL